MVTNSPGDRAPVEVKVAVPEGTTPIGYAWVVANYHLSVLPPRRLSFLSARGGARHEKVEAGQTLVIYPPSYRPGATLCEHLEFALRHEGLNLEVLAALFRSVETSSFEAELTAHVKAQPTGKNTRRLWFLYEFLTERSLPLPDAGMGNYVPLLDPHEYYTTRPVRSRRHRVLDNLLGNRAFCPLVRKSPALEAAEAERLDTEAARIVQEYDEDTIRRAVDYLYTKETRSSFEIEHEKPSPRKAERFMALLRTVPSVESLSETVLVGLQREVVEPRFANSGYRKEQVYIGESVSLLRQRIHYVAPRPEDVPELMAGLLSCLERMARARVDPVVQAAVVAFGFVFIHPFSDGNGRLHRLLIHYVLARAGFTPAGLIFPISAIMLSKRAEYDACLESISAPLMQLVDYEEHEDQSITVKGETAGLYRYPDYTRMAEDLYRWTQETLRTEFRGELDFIVHFRKARAAMEEVVELPDRLANLFVILCLQNGGHLSAAKRQAHFDKLTDAEVAALEESVREHMLPHAKGPRDGPGP